VGELKAEGQEKGEDAFDKRLAIAKQLKVGGFILEINSDSAVFSCRFGCWGIRVRRDNWVSVRYAEELNSGQSSVLLQRADRHGILGQKPPDFPVSL
jgi:hypothetical protein